MNTFDQETLDLLKSIDRKQDRLIERLFGDLDNENPKARFPQIEADVAELKEDYLSLNNDRIRVVTFASIVSAMVGYLLNFFIHPFRH